VFGQHSAESAKSSSNWLKLFPAKPSLISIPQLFSNLVIINLLAYEDGTDSVPKRRHTKFRRRGITQKKTYDSKHVAIAEKGLEREVNKESGRE
jgi:hypothetical protein